MHVNSFNAAHTCVDPALQWFWRHCTYLFTYRNRELGPCDKGMEATQSATVASPWLIVLQTSSQFSTRRYFNFWCTRVR
ncbi:hypothetical protein HZ326_1049 [Fusarium oxysporum f. sp. albedinis]|nr:hypothetical protein HZ326_1049 [Fusarium oxysporum f. sp. albedinis]